MAENQAQHGGKRDGAGRPSLAAIVRKDPRWLAARGANPLQAAEVLQHVVDERRAWQRVFNSPDDRIVLQALMFLVSMRDGRPAQRINVTSTQLTLNANDLERARAIVAELRGNQPSLDQTKIAETMLLGDGEGESSKGVG